MNEWNGITTLCINCGKSLVAKYNHNHGLSMVLAGCYPVLYRHADGTTECVVRYKPGAFSDWDTNAQLKKAEGGRHG